MIRARLVPGVGGIAFAVLLVIAMVLAEPPGGDYSTSDIESYLDDGHRTAVVISLYLALAAAAGLVALFAGLREGFAPGHARGGHLFWGCGVGAAAALAIGWALVVTPPASLALGGGEAADPQTTYLITQAGFVVALGVGGILLGFALITLMLDSAGVLPAWVRWLSLIAGLLGLASVAYLPFFALLVWALVIGLWLVLSGSMRPLDEPAAPPS